MNWDKAKILDTVEKLRRDIRDCPESVIEVKYADFKRDFPKLYEMSCADPNFNINKLAGLINYRDKAENENIPKMVRDVTVGESFAKEYLYPKIGEPTVEQKKTAARKIASKYVN